MNNVINIWKPIGLTPLQAVNLFKEKNQKYLGQKISYAGRLDPMAEGILILLIGEENKNRNKYLDLKKEYESEIIFGISTDSFDSLGLIDDTDFKEVTKDEIDNALKSFIGKHKQIYPQYSSKAVDGKPLFWWARNKKLHEIKLPERKIEIYNIKLLGFENLIVKDMVEKLLREVKNVRGDFRQDEIIKSWEKFKSEYGDKNLIKIKIKVGCSSGTYIRRIADDLGRRVGIFAFAYSIKRISLGEAAEKDTVKVI